MISKTLAVLFFATAYATPFEKLAERACTPCSPQGATGLNPPDVGSDLKSMYVDLLDSVKDIHFEKRRSDPVSDLTKREDVLCCAETMDCVNVQNYNIPMCYDKFQTNYQFADGTTGSLTTGQYNDSDGTTVNLLTGDFTSSNGQTGNIYSDDQAAKPNTATLSIPPQWTGTGVGTPIPATEIASFGPIATSGTIPGSASASPTSPTATDSASSSQNTQNSAPSSTGSASHNSVDTTRSLGMSIIGALMYAIYAL